MFFAGRREPCFPVLGPIVDRFKVTTLLSDSKIRIECLLLLIPAHRHNAYIGVAHQRLPKIVKAVPIMPVAKALGVSRIVDALRLIVKLLPKAVLTVIVRARDLRCRFTIRTEEW